MTTTRKVLLAVLVGVAAVDGYVYWQSRQLPPVSTKVVDDSYHKNGYENAMILNVDEKTGQVRVLTVDSRMAIDFKPPEEHLKDFRAPKMVATTFQCTKTDKKGKCDFSAPFKLFVRKIPVQVVKLIF